MTTLPLRITAGVDTHLDVHVAAALDETGSLLGVESVRHDHRRLPPDARVLAAPASWSSSASRAPARMAQG